MQQVVDRRVNLPSFSTTSDASDTLLSTVAARMLGPQLRKEYADTAIAFRFRMSNYSRFGTSLFW